MNECRSTFVTDHATMSSADRKDHWPVIVNSCLRESELAKILQCQHKVRCKCLKMVHVKLHFIDVQYAMRNRKVPPETLLLRNPYLI